MTGPERQAAQPRPPRADIQALSDLRVLDLSRWVAGEYTAKLFADFGADVIKVEKPGEGSLTRHWGPFPGDKPDIERSALFLHLNTNKRSVVLDLREAAGQELLLNLVASADALIESFRPGHLETLGLGPDILHQRNPRLVITRITPFGQDGPYRGWEATGITVQAMGGPMHCTGDADRAPQRKPGQLEQYSIGRFAAGGTLAGLFAARRSGSGSVVDVSSQEALLTSADRRAAYLLSAAYAGKDAPRGMPSAHRGGSTFTGKFPVGDGYVMVYVVRMHQWNRLVEFIADGDEEFVRKFTDVAVLGDQREEFVSRMCAFFDSHEKLWLMEQGQARRIPLTAYLGMKELYEHEHFRSRGTFAEAGHPAAGRLEYLGSPWRMPRGYQLRCPAPLLGEHTGEIMTELAVR
jgi:formyl-CoA transferase/CoA:oxalate CoA-transferase